MSAPSKDDGNPERECVWEGEREGEGEGWRKGHILKQTDESSSEQGYLISLLSAPAKNNTLLHFTPKLQVREVYVHAILN